MSERVVIETQGILFDMDGVLVSSIASVTRCWRRWAAHYSVPNANQVEIAHGTRAIDIIAGFRPDFGPEEIKQGVRLIEDMEIDDVADRRGRTRPRCWRGCCRACATCSLPCRPSAGRS